MWLRIRKWYEFHSRTSTIGNLSGRHHLYSLHAWRTYTHTHIFYYLIENRLTFFCCYVHWWLFAGALKKKKKKNFQITISLFLSFFSRNQINFVFAFAFESWNLIQKYNKMVIRSFHSFAVLFTVEKNVYCIQCWRIISEIGKEKREREGRDRRE